MARGIFDTIAPEEYLELAEANVRLINTKIKKAEDGITYTIDDVPRAVDDPFPSRLNG